MAKAKKDTRPALNFKSTKQWELHQLNEIAIFNPKDMLPAIFEYVDLESVVGTQIVSHRTENRDSAPSRAQRVAKYGDIFFQTVRPYQKNNCLFEIDDGKQYVFSTGYDQIRSNMDGYFLLSLFQYDKFVKKVLEKCTGTSYPAINSDDLSKITVGIPSDSRLQKKLGAFFRQLDALIAHATQKHEKLIRLKAAMMQKMFPCKGEDVPALRFGCFQRKWTKRKLGDIASPIKEKNKDNLPYESYSISNEGGFIPQNIKFENGGSMAMADKRMYYIVPQNAFAYNPARINIGSIGYQTVGKDVIVSSLYEVFITSSNVNDRFLWHWFHSENFKKMVLKYQEGGVRLYFFYDKFCQCDILLPSYEEQGKIGMLLDSLDTLITLQQKRLTKLKNIKSALLRKMFI